MTVERVRPTPSDDEQALREDLAAAFRLAVQFGWHESVGNHFSAALSDDGRHFLLNPRWQHFSTVRASDLLALHVDDEAVMQSENAPDPSAWCIHGAVHAHAPGARVLLHCHPPYATALCTLADPALLPIDQNTARFYNRCAIDLGFGGIADDAGEGKRIAEAFGNNRVMLMGNHGVSVCGETVADAFETLYYLERAAQTYILALSTGQPLNVMPAEVAERTAAGWEAYRGMGDAHFAHLKAQLDATDPDYRD
ncbi:MAG: class II aldolase/adducin family protein [Pseudomonadota bacterium]